MDNIANTILPNLHGDKVELNRLIDKMGMQLKAVEQEFNTFSTQSSSIYTDHITYAFGIGSLKYQYMLLSTEYKHFKEQHKSIRDRMYCEQYKLFEIMKTYICKKIIGQKHTPNTQSIQRTLWNYTPTQIARIFTRTRTHTPQPEITNVNDVPLEQIIQHVYNLIESSRFEPYVELPPTADSKRDRYSFDTIFKVRETNAKIIDGLVNIAKKQTSILDSYKKKQQDGLNINNFVTSFEHGVVLLEKQALMYSNFIHFLDTSHSENIKYLVAKITHVSECLNKYVSDTTTTLNSENRTISEESED